MALGRKRAKANTGPLYVEIKQTDGAILFTETSFSEMKTAVDNGRVVIGRKTMKAYGARDIFYPLAELESGPLGCLAMFVYFEHDNTVRLTRLKSDSPNSRMTETE